MLSISLESEVIEMGQMQDAEDASSTAIKTTQNDISLLCDLKAKITPGIAGECYADAAVMVAKRASKTAGFGEFMIAHRASQQEIQLALESLISRLDSSYQIAQEGIIDEIRFTLDKFLTSENSLIGRLNEVLNKAESRGLRDKDSLLEADGWIQKLNAGATSTLTSAQVLKSLEDLADIWNSKPLLKSMTEINQAVKSTTKEIRATWFLADSDDIQALKAAQEQAKKACEEVDRKYRSVKNSSKRAVDCNPLQEKDLKKARQLIDQLTTKSGMGDLFKDLASNVRSNKFWTTYNTQWRLSSWFLAPILAPLSLTIVGWVAAVGISAAVANKVHEDIRIAYDTVGTVTDTISLLKTILLIRTEVLFGLARYIEMSTA